MADKNVSMNVDETLEIDYTVEEISDDVISVQSENPDEAYAVNYVNRKSGIFNPSEPGSYTIDLGGETIDVEVLEFDSYGSRFTLNSNDAVYVQGEFSTQYDMNTDTNQEEVNGPSGETNCLSFGQKGDYAIGGLNNDNLYTASMSTKFDLKTASFNTVDDSNFPSLQNIYGIAVTPEGDKLFVSSFNDDHITEYSFNTSFDVSDMSRVGNFNITNDSDGYIGFNFVGDLSTFVTYSLNDSEHKIYTLNTAKTLTDGFTEVDTMNISYEGNVVFMKDGDQFGVSEFYNGDVTSSAVSIYTTDTSFRFDNVTKVGSFASEFSYQDTRTWEMAGQPHMI